MGDRKTLTISTPITNTEVVLKAYITGGEFEELQKFILAQVKVGADGSPIGEMAGETGIDYNHKGLELVVVSVGNQSEKVVDLLLALPREDYQFVLNKVAEITSPKAE